MFRGVGVCSLEKRDVSLWDDCVRGDSYHCGHATLEDSHLACVFIVMISIRLPYNLLEVVVQEGLDLRVAGRSIGPNKPLVSSKGSKGSKGNVTSRFQRLKNGFSGCAKSGVRCYLDAAAGGV